MLNSCASKDASYPSSRYNRTTFNRNSNGYGGAVLPLFFLLFDGFLLAVMGTLLSVLLIFHYQECYPIFGLSLCHDLVIRTAIESRYIDVSRSFGATKVDQYKKVILPALFPYLITGARLGLVHAIRAMVVAEMFIITGYGGLIFQTGLDISTAPILAYLATIMAVSIGTNLILRRIGQGVAPWYEARMKAS